MSKYAEHFESIKLFAKRTGFDFKNGNYDELMKNWIEDGRIAHKVMSEDLKKTCKIIKSFL